MAIAAVGCVQIEGGAAELSWSIRDSDGNSSSCNDSNIRDIRLCWQSVEDSGTDTLTCPDVRAHNFMCNEGTGVTGFEIDPGRTALFVIPLCETGNKDDVSPALDESYEVPPPIVRGVEDGRVVTLNSLLVVVNRTNCCEEVGQTGCNQCTCPMSQQSGRQ